MRRAVFLSLAALGVCGCSSSTPGTTTTATPQGGAAAARADCQAIDSSFPIPGTAKIIRTNDSEFAQAFLTTIPTVRFTPAQKNGVPVKQVTELGQSAMIVMTSGSRPMTPPASARGPNC